MSAQLPQLAPVVPPVALEAALPKLHPPPPGRAAAAAPDCWATAAAAAAVWQLEAAEVLE